MTVGPSLIKSEGLSAGTGYFVFAEKNVTGCLFDLY